jgi:signal transduction histidine kinase
MPSPSVLLPALGITAGVAVLFLVLWAAERIRGVRARRVLRERELDRIELELTLAEQTGRLRTAGELGDLAAAAVASMTAQADRIRLLSTTDPDAAGRAAGDLAETARTALAELRRTADLARGGAADAEELGPAPGLADLDRLLDAHRDRGLSVVLEETGDRLDLPAGAELAVIRILQESLTNAEEHGGRGATARVTLRWTDEGLQLLVDDDGDRARALAAGRDPDAEIQGRRYTLEEDLAALVESPYGRGLTEMRERAALYGGVFSATQVPGVGFSISVVFPSLSRHNGIPL